jgi:putative IMPACT (imprinted ancient) family translation regulator
MLACEYSFYKLVRQLILEHHGQLIDEDFAGDVTLTARFATWQLQAFQEGLQEISRGALHAEIIEVNPETIFPLGAFPEQ